MDIKERGLFKFQELDDFQIRLYLEKQVVELMEYCEEKNTIIHKLTLILESWKNTKGSKQKIENQKELIKNLSEKCRVLKIENQRLTNRIIEIQKS